MRRIWFGCAVAVVPLLVGAVMLGEGAMHIQPSFRGAPDERSEARLADECHAEYRFVEVDGALRATLFTPERSSGRAVILLHGVASSRDGMLGHVRFLLKAGYMCLAPDSRGHGSSGGDLVTYGVREAGDVVRWADFLEHAGATTIFGLGESMGAAVLLQSLPVEPRIRAAVAECSFDTFRHIAADRVSQVSGVPAPALFAPMVEAGFLYARLRYGVDLGAASPADALRRTSTPVLLVHGDRDENIPPAHSERLARVRPVSTQFWRVSGGHHVDALMREPGRFSADVVDWFARHAN